ncbi:MAG: MBL fold metallo-hydrolase [Proteobacteria bacterium]|nr:MBL fold metallo-hydrolase [Pseudomonadota bacterium]
MLSRMKWLGHDTFMIDYENKVIYFDPYQLKDGLPGADYIFITHSHYDHFSKDDIDKIVKNDTVFIGPADVISAIDKNKTVLAEIDETKELDSFSFKSIPAYNTNKEFHPKEKKWVGYILDIGGVKIYHAGDTDRIPEMKGLGVDIALLPVSGTYVMTADEAAEAAMDIKPDIAIPMHYASIVGSRKDAERFAELLKDKVQVKIMEKEV